MKKLAGAIAAMALIGASGAGIARTHQDNSRATEDLNALVHANLAEAVTLRAELPALHDDHRATQVWEHMIRDHTNGAHMLAALDRRLGGSPDMTEPTPEPAEGSTAEIISKTLDAHLDTLHKVQEMREHATGAERGALGKLEGVVKHHIAMIRSLQRPHSHGMRHHHH